MSNFVLIVLDSVGVGELPDAHLYGDEGSNTLANTAKAVKGLNLPNLEGLGLGNIIPIMGVEARIDAQGSWGKMAEQSPGKDTTTGHWELAGIVLPQAFPTYPKGFPKDIIDAFTKAIDKQVLGNKVASGTEIIKELGLKHLQTGSPIVYTSADSVFQIAAHEEIVPLEKLYHWCQIARDILVGEQGVGRVIARPFIGQGPNFTRTNNRKDFSLEPIDKTILDYLSENQIQVTTIGKIYDIFAGRGITKHLPAKGNQDTVIQTIQSINQQESGLIFANLVDFDSLWGHRNDYKGYANGLMDFDKVLPEIIAALKPDDLLLLTADHGCDPTTESTDHSREYVPLLVYGKKLKAVDLGTRQSFTDVAQTIAEFYGLPPIFAGDSFLADIMR